MLAAPIRAAVLLGVATAVASTSARSAPLPQVVIEGNIILPDELYYSLIGWLDFRGPAGITQENAEFLAGRIEAFLHTSGYEIATVKGSIENERIKLTIDEGRLTKVVFKERGTIRTLQLRLLVNVPHQIYNRPSLERQLAEMKEEFDITDTKFVLVPTEDIEHTGFQITDIGSVQGTPTIPPPGSYELHVTLGKSDWDSGFDLYLGYRASEGFSLGGGWSGRHLLFDDDRWSVRADVAAKVFDALTAGERDYVGFSRLVAGGRWLTPALFGTGLRPFLSPYLDVTIQQRTSLNLESYWWLQGGGLLGLGYEFDAGLLLSLGVGVEQRDLFNLTEVPPPPPSTNVQCTADQYLDTDLTCTDLQRQRANTRGIGRLRAEMVFDTAEARLDRRHQLEVEGRVYFGKSATSLWQVSGAYRNVFKLGWHDFIIEARGLAMGGSVDFVDERGADDYVRGVFYDVFWVKRAVSATAEFQFSMSRDLFKMSAFVDGAVLYDHDNRTIFALSVGPGMHALLFDVAQLNLYWGFGFSSEGESDGGIYGTIKKAF